MRAMPLFSERDHPNTLAAVAGEPDHLWVLLHNLGDVSSHASWAEVLSLYQTATFQLVLPRLYPSAPHSLCWLSYFSSYGPRGWYEEPMMSVVFFWM